LIFIYIDILQGFISQLFYKKLQRVKSFSEQNRDMLEVVDQLLERFEVPYRNRKIVKEPAHVLACALRANPNFSKYNEKEVALFAVVHINWHIRDISGRRSGFYKGLKDVTKEERRVLKKMLKVPSPIQSYSRGCLKTKNASITIEYEDEANDKCFILYDIDKWDGLHKKEATEMFGFI